MANRPITITGINADGTLILSDNGNTTASRGDTVTWSIGQNSGVASITGIIDNDTLDIFSPDPSLQPNSSSWQGTINPNLGIPAEENYTIAFTRTGSNDEIRFDPKISVNS